MGTAVEEHEAATGKLPMNPCQLIGTYPHDWPIGWYMCEEIDDDVGRGTWNGAACVGVRGGLLMRRLPLDQVSVVPNGVRFIDVLAVHV